MFLIYFCAESVYTIGNSTTIYIQCIRNTTRTNKKVKSIMKQNPNATQYDRIEDSNRVEARVRWLFNNVID